MASRAPVATLRQAVCGPLLAAVVLAAALLASSAQARTGAGGLRGTYVGTLGADTIVLQVGPGADANGDRYYRRARGVDVPLEVAVRGDALTAEEHASNATFALRARFRLTRAGDGLRGSYELVRSARSLPVALRRVAPSDTGPAVIDAPVLDAWRRTDPYAALKLDRPPARVRLARVAGRTVSWLREPHSAIVFPRLPGAGAVNGALADEHVRRARDALSCPVPGGWAATTRISLLSRSVLSLAGSVQAYCGGAHPDGFPAPATFDLTRGTQAVLEDLYRFVPVPPGLDARSPPGYDAPAFDRWTGYLERRGARLRTLALGVAPATVRGRCWGGGLGDEWTFVTWHLSSTGLVLQGDFPHVADVCDPVTITLPYALVRPFRVAGGPAPG